MTILRLCRFTLGRFLFVACAAASLANSAPAEPGTQAITAGTKLDCLTVGKTTYQNVVVRSVSARSTMITHAGGVSSVLLRDLTPELQLRFGYCPAADQAQETAARAAHAAAASQQKARLEAARKNQLAATGVESGGTVEQLLRSFGQMPELQKEVDLRARFNELGLWVKNQGTRPSCAIFAIVSALEFESAGATNTAEQLSEEYLFWATSKTLNRTPETTMAEPEGSDEVDMQTDAGFSLEEVVTALNAYGIPARDKFPTRFSGNTLSAPPEAVMAEARNARRAVAHHVPGRNGAALAANIVHALNSGAPVPVGMYWPDIPTWRAGYLNGQTTLRRRAHAVTIVGYQCPTGRLEDTTFTFKNSWGTRWGRAGYGTATYAFLSENLMTAVVLELQQRRP